MTFKYGPLPDDRPDDPDWLRNSPLWVKLFVWVVMCPAFLFLLYQGATERGTSSRETIFVLVLTAVGITLLNIVTRRQRHRMRTDKIRP